MSEKIKEVSSVEVLASVVAGTVKQSSVASVRSISYRVPVSLLARVDAFASKAGKTRTFILNSLVEVGLDAVFPLLNSDDAEDVTERASLALSELLASDDLGVSVDD